MTLEENISRGERFLRWCDKYDGIVIVSLPLILTLAGLAALIVLGLKQ